MRKLGVVAVAVASLMLMAFAAFAAEAPVGEDMKGKFSISAFGGLAMPSGKLGEEFDVLTGTLDDGFPGVGMKMSPDFGASVDYFVTKDIAVGADVSYVKMKNEAVAVLGIDVLPEKWLEATTLQFGVHGKYFLPTGGPVRPYLALGAGMYSRKLALTDEGKTALEDLLEGPVDVSEFSDSKFGGNGGVGVEYKVNEMFGVGLNGAYHMTMGKLEHDFGTGTEETVLKDWTYMAFNAQVTFYIPMAKK